MANDVRGRQVVASRDEAAEGVGQDIFDARTVGDGECVVEEGVDVLFDGQV